MNIPNDIGKCLVEWNAHNLETLAKENGITVDSCEEDITKFCVYKNGVFIDGPFSRIEDALAVVKSYCIKHEPRVTCPTLR